MASAESKDGNATLNCVSNSKLQQKCGKTLFLNEDHADVFFIIVSDDPDVQSIKIPAHKIILAAGSEVFDRMFNGGFKEEREIKIDGATAEGVKEFLQFFYLDPVELTLENVAEVMSLADKYMVTECMDVCEQFLMKDIKLEDVCLRYELAIGQKRNDLKVVCEGMISEDPDRVFESGAFLQCSQETLKHILDIDGLGCDGKQMFDACMAWAEQKCFVNGVDATSMDNRRKELGDCLYLIQFGMMGFDQAFECMTKSKGLFTAEELEEILAIILSKDQPSLRRFKNKARISQIRLSAMASGMPVECTRYHSQQPHSNRYYDYIRQCEVTTFRSNVKILLCAVSCIKDVKLSNPSTANMTIVEKFSGPNKADYKMLFKQKVEFRDIGQRLTLRKPIIIEPTTAYEIRINFDSQINQGYYRDQTYLTSYVVDSHIITFERNNDLPYDNTQAGIVTTLHFVRLE